MDWKIEGLKKDGQSVTSDWDLANQILIDGVKTKEIKNVIKNDGMMTEVWRKDWGLDMEKVEQVFQVTLNPKQFSSWHAHEHTIDRVFVNKGLMRVVLYDARKDSPSYGKINEFKIGEFRPMIILIPPKIYHAIQNISSEDSSILNLVDKSYNYENPDHWRLPANSPLIPYKFDNER